MNKPKLVIVEGAQGAGKTTLSNGLREMLTYTQLIRLSGNNIDGDAGAYASFKNHQAVLNYIQQVSDTGLNFVLDRSYLSEEVYSRLYNGESFKNYYSILNKKLDELCKVYDVYLIVLTADANTVTSRLSTRDKPQFRDVSFNVRNSQLQQDIYIRLACELPVAIHRLKATVVDTQQKGIAKVLKDVIDEVLV